MTLPKNHEFMFNNDVTALICPEYQEGHTVVSIPDYGIYLRCREYDFAITFLKNIGFTF